MHLLLDASLPRELTALALAQRGVLTTRQLLEAGLSRSRIHDIGRRDGWRELMQGTRQVAVHDGEGAAEELMRSWNQAAVLVLPHAVLAFDSAAVELRLAGVPRRDGVSVIVPPGRELRARPGLSPHVRVLGPDEVSTDRGLRRTTLARTLADLVPSLDRPTALSVLDSVLRRGSPQSVLGEARRLASGKAGARAVDDLWTLADGDAESPLESRVRLRMVDGHLAPDRLQQKLHDPSGRIYARPDMTIDAARRRRSHRGPLYVEADGRKPHSSPTAAFRDRERSSEILGDDGDVERFTWDDTFDPMRIPWRLRRAL